MAFHFKARTLQVAITISLFCCSGCVSYQILTEIDGAEIAPKTEFLRIDVTTLTDALILFGAPRKIYEVNRQVVLIYQRAVINEKELSFSIPLYQTVRGYDISASGGLQRMDLLELRFNHKGILENFVFEKESKRPFFNTLFQD